MKENIMNILITIGAIVFSGLFIFCANRYFNNKDLLDCVCGCSKYRLEITNWNKYDEWNIKLINFGCKIKCPKCGRGGDGEKIWKDDIKIWWNERTKARWSK